MMYITYSNWLPHFPAFVDEISNGPNFVTNISVLYLLFLTCSCNLSFVVNLNGLILFCKCVILHVSIDELGHKYILSFVFLLYHLSLRLTVYYCR